MFAFCEYMIICFPLTISSSSDVRISLIQESLFYKQILIGQFTFLICMFLQVHLIPHCRGKHLSVVRVHIGCFTNPISSQSHFPVASYLTLSLYFCSHSAKSRHLMLEIPPFSGLPTISLLAHSPFFMWTSYGDCHLLAPIFFFGILYSWHLIFMSKCFVIPGPANSQPYLVFWYHLSSHSSMHLLLTSDHISTMSVGLSPWI